VDLEEALRVESLRLYDRYEREIVEGLGFCPYAAGAREAGKVRVVSLPRAVVQTDVAVAVEALAADPIVDIGIVVLPACPLDRRGFARFVADVRELVPARDAGSFALADFHPDPVESVARAGDLTTFARRSPDPTIQLVRMRALSQVRAKEVHGSGYMDPAEIVRLELTLGAASSPPARAPLHETIADKNRATIEALGFAEVVRRIEDIHRDRELTYRRLRAEAGHDRRADIG
jgi:hypothetical protein